LATRGWREGMGGRKEERKIMEGLVPKAWSQRLGRVGGRDPFGFSTEEGAELEGGGDRRTEGDGRETDGRWRGGGGKGGRGGEVWRERGRFSEGEGRKGRKKTNKQKHLQLDRNEMRVVD